MKVEVHCDWCGKKYEKYVCKLKQHNFCCRECLNQYQSKSKNPDGYRDLKNYTPMSENMSRINRDLNKTRMTKEVREKLRKSRLKANSVSYEKLYGKHMHRVIAESILKRPLGVDEVVHHIDRNKRNNAPENLVVLTRSEHARLHALCKGRKEVMSNAFRAARLSEVLHRADY